MSDNTEPAVLDNQFHRDNHFVPQLYLKAFEAPDGRVNTYQLLVTHSHVPLWKRRSVKGLGYLAHLYTRLAAGRETDQIERWLDREFEAPAREPLRKAISQERLTETDWMRIVRFLAAQDVRTPARFHENIERWSTMMPRLLENSMKIAVRKLEAAKSSGVAITQNALPDTEFIPFRLTKEVNEGESSEKLKGEVIAGRGLWLFSMRHTLRKTARILHDHKWTILRSPEGIRWFTSDDPVIRLNYAEKERYDFKGGWGSAGTEIFLPLDCHSLLYTKVGGRPPRRGEVIPRADAEGIRRLIAEHAHRAIFSAIPDADVPTLRPRTVDAQVFRQEKEHWQRWHEEQSRTERELMGWSEDAV